MRLNRKTWTSGSLDSTSVSVVSASPEAKGTKLTKRRGQPPETERREARRESEKLVLLPPAKETQKGLKGTEGA